MKRIGGKRAGVSVFLPLLLAAIVYFASISNRGITDYDEGYYVQPAIHMVESGNWVTPYADGVRFLEKPPLLYWITAVSFKIFGINEVALRLPTAFAVVALVWTVMLIVRVSGNERAVPAAGLAAAFSVGTYLFTRETLHDVWLVLFLALSVYAFLKWYLDPLHPLRHALMFYGAVAGAFLCKSLIGVAFPAGIAAVFFLLSREWPRWKTLHFFPGVVLFLLLAAPWHILAAFQNPGFLRFFFVEEQLLRFLGLRELPVLWSVPLWLFWILIPVWFFPWTAFLPAAFSDGWRPEDKNQRILFRIGIAWAAVVLGFFSLSARLEHYAFPALPALALLVSAVLGRKDENRQVLWGFRGLAFLGLLILMSGCAAGIWLASSHGLEYSAAGSADRISETDFSIMADMPPEIVKSLLRPAAVTVVAMAFGFFIACRFEERRKRGHALLSIAAVMIIVFGMAHWSMGICENMISSKQFAVAIARESGPEDRIVVVGDYESANSLNFYTRLNVEVVEGQAYALIPGMKFPDSPKVVLTPDEFQAAWDSSIRLFVLVPESRLDLLEPGGIEIMRALHRVLLRNR